MVDEWFGLYYKEGKFEKILSMDVVIEKAQLHKSNLPNQMKVSDAQVTVAERLLEDVVAKTLAKMEEKYHAYKTSTDPYIDEELERLIELEERHKDCQLSIFEMLGQERKKSEKEREIEAIFSDFSDWVKDTLEIEEKPYIRIIAVITGVK